MIKISAIVCTFKRPDYLRHALRSLCNQTLPADQYEILVIDNAVEAETERVANEFQDGKINLRYVKEKETGLSRARNKGLKEPRGHYLAYMDDDARADEHWLQELVWAFEGRPAAPAAVGGRVWLDWQGDKPSWVPDDQLPLFTYVDHGEEGHRLGHNEYLVGANLAFDKTALKAIGGFDVNLGRQGDVLLSGEEARVLRQLLDRGAEIYYEPAAVVWHSVHPSRKRPTWLLKRMFWDGASQPLLNGFEERCSRRKIIWGVLSDLRQCISSFVHVVAAMFRGKRCKAFEFLLGLSQRAGRVRTQLRMLSATPN
jgi:glucosyl-dolichyl phosphate glucuronosyltransferase